MYRKCASIMVVLFLTAMGNYAFGAVVDSFGYQDDWHNESLTKVADYNEPATITDGCDWHEPGAWGAQRNADNGGTTVPCRPPDFNVFAAIEPKPPGPNITGDINCSRLSIMPWSWANDDKTVGFKMTVLSSAGDLNCGSHIGLADMVKFNGGPSPGWGYPILDIYGGTMHTPGFSAIDGNGTPYTELTGLQIGGGYDGVGACYGTINMYGGSIIVPKIAINFGDVNLYGGLLYDTDTNEPNFVISQSQPMNKINIEGNDVSGGELRLQGDRREGVGGVWYYYGKGRICPCNGKGTLSVEYNDVDNYTSATAYCTPGSAWDPDPADRKDRVELAPTLTWEPGSWVQDAGGTGRHAVYFGTDFNDVNTCATWPDATTAEYNSETNELTVHIVFSCEDNLEIECDICDVNTYFTTNTPHWEVNEIVVIDGRTYLKLVRDAIAEFDEDVVISHVNDINEDRGFTGHILLTEGDVAFQNACCVPTLRTTNSVCSYKGRQDSESYTPAGPLVSDTTYFWRVDEYNDTNSDSPWKGNIWQFKTKGPVAGEPVPADEAVGLSVPLQLSWSAGSMVAATNGHDIYFGTNEANVTDGTPDTYKGRQTPTIYPLSSLDYNLAPDTNYYWRIDEINDTNVWKGETWMFRNTNYFIIDDFESYDNNEAMWIRWETGDVYESCEYRYPSGKISWVYALPGEGRGNGSMRYDYDDYSGNDNCGSCYFSEVRFDANGADWTGGGALPDNDKASALSISYIGAARNDADPNYDTMYVAIEDTDGNFGSMVKNSTDAQRTNTWKEWNIKLTDLNSPNNVNLKAIKYLYLGFGVRCNIEYQGGIGTVRFDDIRLYQSRCVPEYGPDGDLSGDCRVDINDVNMFADEWLEKQEVISPVTEPPEANLMLWYKFEETTGTTVTDSSGHAKHGTVLNPPQQPPPGADIVWDPNGGYDGNGCINLRLAYKTEDYNTCIACPNTALNFVADKNAITFAVWINADVYSPPALWPRLVSVFQDMNEANDTPDLNEVVEIECPVTSDLPYARFVAGLIGDGNKPESNEVSAVDKGLQWSDFGNGWNHYVFIKDTDANLMRIYHNGELIAEGNQMSAPMFGRTNPIESFRIARARILPHWTTKPPYELKPADEPWVGKIDDFRVYDYALSDAEIGWLGTKGTGYVPFKNVANFKGSTPEAVNFEDYAIMAEKWLASPVLWP